MIPRLSERRLSPAEIEQFAREHAAKIGPRRDSYKGEARKGGHDTKGPPPSDTQNVTASSSKKANKTSPPSPKKKASPKKSKRSSSVAVAEPVAKKAKSSKSTKVLAIKGPADQPEEVTLNFPADSAVLNKDGWDKVYHELHKLEFDYEKAALDSLDGTSRVKKAICHHLKVNFSIIKSIFISSLILSIFTYNIFFPRSLQYLLHQAQIEEHDKATIITQRDEAIEAKEAALVERDGALRELQNCQDLLKKLVIDRQEEKKVWEEEKERLEKEKDEINGDFIQCKEEMIGKD